MGKELIIDQDPKSPIAEIFRTLRTNLQFMTSNQGLKTLLVTSSVPGEGKSWVSANLAVAFAGEGKKIALIDSDMRKGRLHTIFEIDKKPGLSNYLSGVSEVEDKEDLFSYFKKTNVEGLYVMPAGDVPPNPSELLVCDKMQELVEKLKNTFDMVIFDGTPVLLVTDSVILSRQLDSSLIVTSYKSTKMGDVEKIKKMIENVGGKIAGVVINKIPVAAKKYESTYYYGNHEESNKSDNVDVDSISSQEENTNIEDEILKEIEEFDQKEEKKEEEND
ncbi:MAG: CpsD/CapB family tyrosine-protein kinase [Clostridia bacterium]|nr:CpsD/CapB family tyrosine-protein kinase [Clostridia bacterium]